MTTGICTVIASITVVVGCVVTLGSGGNRSCTGCIATTRLTVLSAVITCFVQAIAVRYLLDAVTTGRALTGVVASVDIALVLIITLFTGIHHAISAGALHAHRGNGLECVVRVVRIRLLSADRGTIRKARRRTRNGGFYTEYDRENLRGGTAVGRNGYIARFTTNNRAIDRKSV